MSESSSPQFLQGVFGFEGQGLDEPFLLDKTLSYTVPPGAVTQPVYLRAGNSSPELVYLALMRDGEAMRLFPIAARGSTHVSLRVVEDLLSDTLLELYVGAPKGVTGTLVVDAGLVEI